MNLDRITGRIATIATTTFLTLAGLVATATPASAAIVNCKDGYLTGFTSSCSRITADGDPGGVSGAVRLTTTNGNGYLRAEFQAKGEHVYLYNTTGQSAKEYLLSYTLRRYVNGSWTTVQKDTLGQGTRHINLSIGENIPVRIFLCASGYGCATATGLKA
ncbi:MULTISPECIES: hypothetical protein [unclassified Streptomyces]|uniref:hypothetical protein n=1 Tax=unclassified Streptomyces TaxID=2593676 RepID=UPI0033337DD8